MLDICTYDGVCQYRVPQYMMIELAHLCVCHLLEELRLALLWHKTIVDIHANVARQTFHQHESYPTFGFL
jgi:hypothetical protein